jgi:hypothetical protein
LVPLLAYKAADRKRHRTGRPGEARQGSKIGWSGASGKNDAMAELIGRAATQGGCPRYFG